MNHSQETIDQSAEINAVTAAESAAVENEVPRSTALPKRYHPLLVAMHWSVALLVAVNMFIGIFLFRLVASRTLTGFHMVVGITVLLLMTARFFVRIFTRHPARASTGSKLLDLAGDLTHYALYVLVIVVTAFGILFAGESGLTQSILFKAMPSGGGLIGSLQLWGIPLITYHRFAAYALLGLILLHIGAAGFHELVLKDRLISRMWFRRGNN